MRVAHRLGKSISSKKFPVGSLLPTEEKLCADFSVSRHTIREAIRHLRAQGLLSARRGIGTRVEAINNQPQYSQSLDSLSALAQYDDKTVLEIIFSRRVRANASLAEMLGTRVGRTWVHIGGLRRSPGKKRQGAASWTDIYVDQTFSDVLKDSRVPRTAIYTLIERKYGETVVEIQQDIKAALVPKEHADALGAKPNSPALLITRRYFGTGGRLMEVTMNLHPADRFHYSMCLKRDVLKNGAAEKSA
jgi:DNA-binding GntR family transcriptional regulator